MYYYDGEKYVKEFDSKASHGYYIDSGHDAYQRQDYVIAEKFYLNAFRMWSEQDPVDANNLALTWIKQGKLDAARSLLDRVLAGAKRKKVRSAAYFNLALLAEARDDPGTASEYFEKANIELQPEQNYLLNGAFDGDTTSWTSRPSIEWSSALGNESPGSARTVVTSDFAEGRIGPALYQCISVEGVSSFNVGASYKSDNSNSTQEGSGQLSITWHGEDKCHAKRSKDKRQAIQLPAMSGSEWQTIGPIAVLVPGKTRSATFFVQQTVRGKGKYSMYWDDIYFRPVEDQSRGFMP